MGPMAPFSIGVAVAPTMPSPPIFGSGGCKDFISESFSFLVPFLPLLTLHAAVFQAFGLLTNVADQDIDINY